MAVWKIRGKSCRKKGIGKNSTLVIVQSRDSWYTETGKTGRKMGWCSVCIRIGTG